MSDEKILGAPSATEVVSAGSIASDAAPHAAHTPGPWTAERQVSREGKSLGWIVNHANGRIGWSSYATSEPNEGESAPHTQGGANAHLIAAAPELLTALKAAQLWVVFCQAHMSDPHTHPQALENIKADRELIRLAIAKAEGR